MYWNQDDSMKRYKALRYYLPKGIIKIAYKKVEKTFWPTYWFWYEMIQRNQKFNSRARWRSDYMMFVGLWLHHWIIIHYRLIAVDLSRQKELDADPKAFQHIEFVGWLKILDDNSNATDAGAGPNMFVLMMLEKIKETRLKFSQGSATEKIGKDREL